jgi:hypothetical protein
LALFLNFLPLFGRNIRRLCTDFACHRYHKEQHCDNVYKFSHSDYKMPLIESPISEVFLVDKKKTWDSQPVANSHCHRPSHCLLRRISNAVGPRHGIYFVNPSFHRRPHNLYLYVYNKTMAEKKLPFNDRRFVADIFPELLKSCEVFDSGRNRRH